MGRVRHSISIVPGDFHETTGNSMLSPGCGNLLCIICSKRIGIVDLLRVVVWIYVYYYVINNTNRERERERERER